MSQCERVGRIDADAALRSQNGLSIAEEPADPGYGWPMTSVEAAEDSLELWESISVAVRGTASLLLESVEKAGIPSQWFGVLRALLAAPGHRMPMNRLAQAVSMSSGGLTKLADRMGREGVIDRRASSGDRRVVFAALTSQGLRLARRAEHVHRAALEEHVLGVLSEARLRRLAVAVRPLNVALSDHSKEVPSYVTERDPRLPDRRRGA